MSLQQFHNDFNTSVHKEDFERANDSLMRELGKILVRNKKDFVDMLNESNVEADLTDSDAQLIESFIENAKGNKKLLLGASLLVNMHNQQIGFDGDEEISDEGVKTSYIILNSYFNDQAPYEEEEQSNWIGKLAKVAKKFIDNRKNGENKDSTDWLAKQQMIQAAYIEKQKAEAEAKRIADEKKRKKQRNQLFIGGSIVLALTVITIIIVRKRKNK